MEECIARGDEDSLNRYGEIQHKYESNDGYIIEERIEKELGKLKVTMDVLERPFSSLSHGERCKIMIASLFLKKNAFLLIDEPTNHLDQEGRAQLASYLQSKKGFILVSHDRAFLDQCIDHVLSINKTSIEVQKGNYTSWNQNREYLEQYEKNRDKQLKKDIFRLEESMGRTIGWSDDIEKGKIGSGVADRGYVGHQSAKMMKRAKSIENRRAAEIKEKEQFLKNVEVSDSLKMNVKAFHKVRYMELIEATVSIGDKVVLSNINLQLYKGDRLEIQGPNGSGKSTLLKLILG